MALLVRNLFSKFPQQVLTAHKNSNNLLQVQQVAGITSAYGKARKRPYKTFDYRKKKFRHYHEPFDRAANRYDDNTRVIIIDGPIASGKHEFAKNLAKELDFLYVPLPDIKNLYWEDGRMYDREDMNHYRADQHYDDLDDLIPERLRRYTLERFLRDDKAKVSAGGVFNGELQFDFFSSRLFTYNDAMLHLFSTGQGVVCVRSPWSDQVFSRALYDNGYLTKEAYVWIRDTFYPNMLCQYPRPHLLIYLDATVDETLENIKRRNRDPEASSKVLTPEFLQSMENEYKDTVLPKLNAHSELLVYPAIPDVTEHEVQLMVEDIEELGTLEHSGFADDQFLYDWRAQNNLTNEEMSYKRRLYQDVERHAGGVYAIPRTYRAPEFDVGRENEIRQARKKVHDKLYPDWDSKFPEEQQDAKGFLGYMMMDIHQWTLTPPDPGELRQFWVQPPDYKLGGPDSRFPVDD